MKQCSKCRKWKLLKEFCRDKQKKDGFCSSCKDCMHRYYEIHKTEIIKRGQKYRKTFIGYLRSRFQTMKQRCNDVNFPYYKNYGGRGIKCLFESSQKFIDYVLNELQVNPKGLQIDRIDNNGHYEPGNIRFTTAKVNSNNRRKRK